MFTRGDEVLAQHNNYTALMEADGARARTLGRHGLLMRWVLLGEPDKAQLILERIVTNSDVVQVERLPSPSRGSGGSGNVGLASLSFE